MDLAIIRGQCSATVKDSSLVGHRLVMVQLVSPDGEPSGPIEVALDVTSAAPGQTVLLARGSAARLPAPVRQLATDLTVVAIVDEITLDVPPDAGAHKPSNRSSTNNQRK